MKKRSSKGGQGPLKKRPAQVRMTYSAGGVIVNPDGRVLLVSQKGRHWSFPKGHIEPGEHQMTAARREIYEETGLWNLDFVRELGTIERPRLSPGSVPEYKVITLFLFRSEAQVAVPRDPDNPEARWVEKGKVLELLKHEATKAFYRKIVHLL